MNVFEIIEQCRKDAAEIVSNNPLVNQVHFKIEDIPYDQFMDAREGKDPIISNNKLWVLIYDSNGFMAGNCQIKLITVPGKVSSVTNFEPI